jgi:hypothetical protein
VAGKTKPRSTPSLSSITNHFSHFREHSSHISPHPFSQYIAMVCCLPGTTLPASPLQVLLSCLGALPV